MNYTFHFACTTRGAFKLPFLAVVLNNGSVGGRMRMWWFQDQFTLGM